MVSVVSKDDRVFAILKLCESGDIPVRKLTCGVYLMAILGMDCDFRCQITQCGVSSSSLENYLEDVEFIRADSKGVRLNESGKEYLASMMLTDDEWDKVNEVSSVVNTLPYEDLEFVVLTDMLITEVCEKYGVLGLVEKKGMIIKSLDTLTSVYSEENFNDAIKLLREIGRDWK